MLDWNAPNAKWFVGGKINAELQLPGSPDRIRATATKPPSSGKASPHRRTGRVKSERSPITQLNDDVCQFANGLKKLGVKKRRSRHHLHADGSRSRDRDAGLCAARRRPLGHLRRIQFSQAIADRVEDAKSNIIITADGGFRRGAIVPLKNNVDDALTKTNRVKKRRRASSRTERRAVNMVQGPRRLVERCHRRSKHRLPRRADGRRRSALRPLHLRFHRQAQGIHAHHRRIHGRHAI